MKKEYTLICKTCGATRHYSCIQSFSVAKKRIRCNKCKRSFKSKWKEELTPDEYDKRMNAYKKTKSLESSGKNNPMYGKSAYTVMVEKYGKIEADTLWKIHNEKTSLNSGQGMLNKSLYYEWKGKYGKIEADRRWKSRNEKTSLNNGRGMLNKSVYSVWVLKYGKEIADEKMKKYRIKLSEQQKGEKNHMYGKPSPHGSGNGWKGHYKGWFFRSLRELSYMITVIEKNNYTWKTAETRDLSIEYFYFDGKKRTYRADFIINGNIMVEIKPIKLHNTPLILLKKDAAEKFCQTHNLSYHLTDCNILDIETLKKLYISKDIIFHGIYEEKFKQYLLNNKDCL